jgi:hypothetical protein
LKSGDAVDDSFSLGDHDSTNEKGQGGLTAASESSLGDNEDELNDRWTAVTALHPP